MTKDLVTRISRGFARTTASRFESTAPSNEFFGKSNSHTSRVQIDSICEKVGRNHHRSMDFRCSPTGLKTCVSKPSYTNWNKGNICSERCSKSFFIRRGRKLVRKTSYRVSSSRPRRSRVLFNIFPCTEEGRRLSSNIESKTIKQVPKGATFQDGNITVHNSSSGKGRLGGILGPKGCISSCTSVSTAPQISQILHQQSPLSVSLNAFRASDSSQNFYKDSDNYRRLPSHERNLHLHVSRRLVNQKQRTYQPSLTPSHNITQTNRLGSCSKPREITSQSISEDNLSGSSVQSTNGNSLSNRGTLYQFMPNYFYYYPAGFCTGPFISPNFGPYGFMHRFSTPSETTHATHPAIPLVPLVSETGRHIPSRSDQGLPEASLGMVDPGVKHFQGGSTGTEASRLHNVDGCLQSRLGSPYGQSECIGNMDTFGQSKTHKLPGNVSSAESTYSLQEPLNRQTSHDKKRQLDSSVLHQSTRGDEVSSVVHVGVDNLSMVHEMEHSDQSSSHSGQEKCTGRQFVSRECESENNRVEPVSNSSRSALQHLYKTKHRLVCNKRKSQNSDILLPVPGAGSLELRRSGVQLDGDLRICVSPTHINPKDTSENETGDVYTPTDCAAISEAVMVSNTSKSARGHTNDVTFKRGFIKSKKGSNKTSRPSKSQISSLENIRQCGSPKFFSKKAESFITNSRRRSTRKVYDARITIFRNWCASRNVCPYTISVTDLAEFFIYLHEVRGLKASTISGYKSAIASIHKGWNHSTVSNNVSLSRLIKGIYNVSPTVKTLLPNWDLPPVLWSLCDSPFEPLGSCDLKYLTWKTVFLVAMATASRVSEIHALSIDSQHMRFEKNGIRLLPNLNFLAKTQRLGKPWDPLFVPEFNTYATEARDQLLCPCRALRMYVKRTKTLRNRETALFVTYKQNYHQRASKDSISRWIVSLIRYCVETKGINLTSVRAHDTRRLSTSWALFNGASTEEIVKAAHWANESTFTSFYMRDVPSQEARFARLSILGTLKANQHKKKD